jgi:hypothetical protein
MRLTRVIRSGEREEGKEREEIRIRVASEKRSKNRDERSQKRVSDAICQK